MKTAFIITLLVAAALIAGCTDAKNARRVLESSGYSGIEVTGFELFGCGQDDFFRTGFSATGQDGRKVHGVVCQGLLFKGATVRIK